MTVPCPLCNQRITVFRRNGKDTRSFSLENCGFSYSQIRRESGTEAREDSPFLLIVPGGGDIRIGDRVYPGELPGVPTWEFLIPARIPGLCQVGYVRPVFLDGRLCHVEAGR